MISVGGKANNLMAIWGGDLTPYDEVYVGDVRVWPDVTGDGAFLIKRPDFGTLDFLYWLHAVDATDDADARRRGAYMRFRVGGRMYYINRGPNGAEVVKLEGDVVNLSNRQMEQMLPYLGDSVDVECYVPQRQGDSLYGTQRNDWHEDVFEKKEWYLPLLPDSKIKLLAHKGARKEWAYANNINIKGLPSGHMYLSQASNTATGKGRYHWGTEWIISNVVLTDNAMDGTLNLYGCADYTDLTQTKQGLFPVYPAFSRTFRLDIVSVS